MTYHYHDRPGGTMETLLEQVASVDAARLLATAEDATRNGNWADAAQLWATIRTIDPGVVRAYSAGASSLAAMLRFEECDALLQEAMARFPDRSHLACEYVWTAARRQDFPEANRRFDTIRQQHPDAGDMFHTGSNVLEWQARFDEAEHLLGEGIARHPDDSSLAMHLINVLTGRIGKDPGAPERAVACLSSMRQRFPDFAPGYAVGVKVHSRLGNRAAADELAVAALRHWPDNWELLAEYAGLAESAGE